MQGLALVILARGGELRHHVTKLLGEGIVELPA